MKNILTLLLLHMDTHHTHKQQNIKTNITITSPS